MCDLLPFARNNSKTKVVPNIWFCWFMKLKGFCVVQYFIFKKQNKTKFAHSFTINHNTTVLPSLNNGFGL